MDIGERGEPREEGRADRRVREAYVVIPGNEDLVRVRRGVEPCEGAVKF